MNSVKIYSRLWSLFVGHVLRGLHFLVIVFGATRRHIFKSPSKVTKADAISQLWILDQMPPPWASISQNALGHCWTCSWISSTFCTWPSYQILFGADFSSLEGHRLCGCVALLKGCNNPWTKTQHVCCFKLANEIFFCIFLVSSAWFCALQPSAGKEKWPGIEPLQLEKCWCAHRVVECDLIAGWSLETHLETHVNQVETFVCLSTFMTRWNYGQSLRLGFLVSVRDTSFQRFLQWHE